MRGNDLWIRWVADPHHLHSHLPDPPGLKGLARVKMHATWRISGVSTESLQGWEHQWPTTWMAVPTAPDCEFSRKIGYWNRNESNTSDLQCPSCIHLLGPLLPQVVWLGTNLWWNKMPTYQTQSGHTPMPQQPYKVCNAGRMPADGCCSQSGSQSPTCSW